MTQAHAENESQIPNDLAIIGVEELMDSIEKDYPEMEWVSRIQFGGLLDVPTRMARQERKEQRLPKPLILAMKKKLNG